MLTKSDYDYDYKKEKNLTKKTEKESIEKHGENSRQRRYNSKKKSFCLVV